MTSNNKYERIIKEMCIHTMVGLILGSTKMVFKIARQKQCNCHQFYLLRNATILKWYYMFSNTGCNIIGPMLRLIQINEHNKVTEA